MIQCNEQQLGELDRLIAALASEQLTQPCSKIRSHSYSGNTAVNEGSGSLSWAPFPNSQGTKSQKKACHSSYFLLSFIFTGHILSTVITTIPLFNQLKILFEKENQLWASVIILTIPVSLSIFDSYRSIFSAIHEAQNFEKSTLTASIRINSTNGFPISLKPSHDKKTAWIVSLFRLTGSLFIPICYSFTAADIAFSASQLSSIHILAFFVSLTSFLLESQINHSFFLLARFVSAKTKNISRSPNKLQQLWITMGCWLNMKRRFTNGIYMVTTLSLSFAIPDYIIENTDLSPNHLYWGGLMGLSIASCLAQITKHYDFIQSQNKQLALILTRSEKIRSFLFDRPELALLWTFSTTLRTEFICLFSLFSIILLGLPICDRLLSTPKLNDYRADAYVFSLGTLYLIFIFHSLLSKNRPSASEQISHSTWESLLLACSTSALLNLIGEYTDYENKESYIKVISFISIYIAASLVVTTRDYSLNQLKINNLFWQSPVIQHKKRVQSLSDSILYNQSKASLQLPTRDISLPES
jgi:hypothetical protein